MVRYSAAGMGGAWGWLGNMEAGAERQAEMGRAGGNFCPPIRSMRANPIGRIERLAGDVCACESYRVERKARHFTPKVGILPRKARHLAPKVGILPLKVRHLAPKVGILTPKS